MKRVSKLSAALLLSTFFFSTLASAEEVHLKRHPGSKEEKTAISLNMDVIRDSQAHGEKPVIVTDSVSLGTGKLPPALFVQIQSARLCGAAGCATSIYLFKNGQWQAVLDAVNGSISVLSTRHGGMADLLIDEKDKWIWDGSRYNDPSANSD